MMWIVLDLVLCPVLLIYCLPTVESEKCQKTEIIVGRLGEELEFNFTFSDLIDEYEKFINQLYGKGIIRHEVKMQDLKTNSMISMKRDDVKEYLIFKDGKRTEYAGSQTEISMTNDAFVVKKSKLQKEDVGIYSIKFRSIPLRKKALVITGKRTIMERSVLKPEDNHISTIQLECHSVSTSIGDCITMYTVWYTNGMRMAYLDPTLSQINVTVDHNSRNYACLVTDDLPCYERLQTTMHFNDVLNIEECDNVSESETFILQPEYPPIVKLEPDQREITVNNNESLLLSCSAECHPKCKIRWEKEFQVLKSSGLIFITESVYGKDLKIENINSSHEGFYVCLVSNIHGEVKKGFTLRVRETEKKAVNSVDSNEVVIAVIVTVVVTVNILAVIVAVIKCKNHRKKKHIPDVNGVVEDISAEEEHIYDSIPDLHHGELLLGTSTDNNSRNDEQNMNAYDALEFNTSNNGNPDSKGGYSRLFKLHLRYPKWFGVLLGKKMAMFNDKVRQVRPVHIVR